MQDLFMPYAGKEDMMMLPLKSGLFATAASALLLTAPLAPAAAAPTGVAPAGLVRTQMPIDHVRYRRHVAHRVHHGYVNRRAYVARYYGHRHRYYRRHYRYGFNPGAAIIGGVLGTIAGAAAYDYYDPGYYSYPYAYPAYGYGYAYPAYPAYYGGGWGWRRGWGGPHMGNRWGHWR